MTSLRSSRLVSSPSSPRATQLKDAGTSRSNGRRQPSSSRAARLEEEDTSRRASSPSLLRATPLEDENLIGEILVRMNKHPPCPQTVASVHNRWRSMTMDDEFRQRYRAHHRKPPVLGLALGFRHGSLKFAFRPTVEKICLNQICCLQDDHEDRFNGWVIKDCRHGRLLFEQLGNKHASTVCDPISDGFITIKVPQQFRNAKIVNRYWAVLYGDDGAANHVHGHCITSLVKVILVGNYQENNQGFVIASVYTSNQWSDVQTTVGPSAVASAFEGQASVLIGSTIHWLVVLGRNVIQFNQLTQSLTVVENERPDDVHCVRLISSDSGYVGLATLRCSLRRQVFETWEKIEDHTSRVTRWLRAKTVDLDTVFPELSIDNRSSIVCSAEEDGSIFFRIGKQIYMVQPEKMTYNIVYFEGDPQCVPTYHPFASFFSTAMV